MTSRHMMSNVMQVFFKLNMAKENKNFQFLKKLEIILHPIM